MHTRFWFTLYYLCIAKVHTDKTPKLGGKSCVLCTSSVHAKQKCTRAVHTNNHAHSSRLTSHVRMYTSMYLLCILMPSTIHAYAGFVASTFTKMIPHACSVKYKLICTITGIKPSYINPIYLHSYDTLH